MIAFYVFIHNPKFFIAIIFVTIAATI